MCLRLWEKVLTGLTDPLNMIHTKIAHAGIRVNVGRARTMGKRKATRVGCWGWGLSLHFFVYKKQNSAGAWRAAMAPRQLLLELEEVDMAAEKGPKRVRVDSADDTAQCRYDCPPERLPASPA